MAQTAQQGGSGADGRQPDVPVQGLLNQGGHSRMLTEVVPPLQAAGKPHHIRLGQVHLSQGQIGLHFNLVAARDQFLLHPHQGYRDARPAQQVDGNQGLRLLKSGC